VKACPKTLPRLLSGTRKLRPKDIAGGKEDSQ